MYGSVFVARGKIAPPPQHPFYKKVLSHFTPLNVTNFQIYTSGMVQGRPPSISDDFKVDTT